MTEENVYWNMWKRQVGLSADELADTDWYKPADDEQIVKKAVLTPEQAKWFEKYKDLPFFKNDSTEHFTKKVLDYSVTWEDREHCYNLFSQAYFNDYTIKKEKKYYIKLGFDFSKYLNVKEDGDWWFTNEMPTILGQSQFTQTKIDEMQKDPRAKGLDLNVLKVEVPEDELED